MFAEPAVDARTYTEQAARIAAGNWLGRGEGPFWQPPFYPYLLAAAAWLSQDSFFHAVRYAQALWGALLCALLFFLGSRLFNGGTGLTAGLAAAAYGPFLYFDGELLPASLAAGLDTLALALLLHFRRRPSAAGFGAAGVVAGLAALAVPTVFLFAAACAGWLALRRPRRHAAAFLSGAVLAIAPVTLRNLVVGGDAVLISYNSGINFYIGNNSRYEETVAIRPGWEWDALAARPRQAGLERPSRQSAFFWGEAWREIRAAPADYLRLLARKLFLLGHGEEIGRNQPIYFHRSESSLLAALLWKHGGIAFPFGIAGPLAISGLLLALRNRREPLPALFYHYIRGRGYRLLHHRPLPPAHGSGAASFRRPCSPLDGRSPFAAGDGAPRRWCWEPPGSSPPPPTTASPRWTCRGTPPSTSTSGTPWRGRGSPGGPARP